MTTRRAKIVDSEEKGPSTHGFRDDEGDFLFDTSPDRLSIQLKPLNCSMSEFIEWFYFINEYNNYELIVCDDGSLIDLSGTSLDVTVGRVIEINFDEYFHALVETRIKEAHLNLSHYELKDESEVVGMVEEEDPFDFDIPYD
ncbi:hypothetical protein OCT63_18250 [Vibrio sp. RW]|uniref:hypothetical protein n=1 Tax=Vibrio sp. RW TaxID=2998833 RepID=UPI0022CD73AD|nr:hypothetical protein [Vibrio sp. RW]MDA0146171.1 hypothetical protein [Vibrio sp. RW]